MSEPHRHRLMARMADFARGTGVAVEVATFEDWDPTEWLDQLPTSGALTRLPPDNLAEVTEGVGAAIDRLGGSFTMPYTTVVVTAVRTCRSPVSPASS